MTLISLTSLLFVSFCLLPCGKFGAVDVNAVVHQNSHYGHTDGIEGHGCHSGARSDMEIKGGDGLNCLHCDSSPLATLQDDTKPQVRKAALETAQISCYSTTATGASSSYLLPENEKPPGLSRAIHLLNSIHTI